MLHTELRDGVALVILDDGKANAVSEATAIAAIAAARCSAGRAAWPRDRLWNARDRYGTLGRNPHKASREPDTARREPVEFRTTHLKARQATTHDPLRSGTLAMARQSNRSRLTAPPDRT